MQAPIYSPIGRRTNDFPGSIAILGSPSSRPNSTVTFASASASTDSNSRVLPVLASASASALKVPALIAASASASASATATVTASDINKVIDVLSRKLHIDKVSIIPRNSLIQEGVSAFRLVVARSISSKPDETELIQSIEVSDYITLNTSTGRIVSFIKHICNPHANHISLAKLLQVFYTAFALSVSTTYDSILDLSRAKEFVERFLEYNSKSTDTAECLIVMPLSATPISVHEYNNNPRHALVEIPYSSRTGIMGSVVCCPQCGSDVCRQTRASSDIQLKHKGRVILTRLTKTSACRTTDIAVFECCGRPLVRTSSDQCSCVLISSNCDVGSG